MTKSKPVLPCAVCSKPTKQECAHVDCPNRKRVTASVPGESSLRGMSYGASYRKTYQDK